MGEDLFAPLSPIVFSLYDNLLRSHCSSCALSLPSAITAAASASQFFFCSAVCAAASSSSFAAESALLRRRGSFSGESSDLRAAIRLLLLCRRLGISCNGDRVGGLLCNSNLLISDHISKENGINGVEIRARAMAMAEALRDCVGEEKKTEDFCFKRISGGAYGGGRVLEEEVLCAVLTNAVEVQSRGGIALGIAVYDTPFSWINHSCSPNTCYRFSEPGPTGRISSPLKRRLAPYPPTESVNWFEGDEAGCGGPAIIVRSIRPIRKGEEVTITYTDLLKNKDARRSELRLNYGFFCSCIRCDSSRPSYVDTLLQEMTISPSMDRIPDYSIYFRKLSTYVENAVSDYFSYGDPDLCCSRLEYFLIQTSRPGSPAFLHPCHHLCLDAYTALASVYKHRADARPTAIDLSRTASGFSLLLAGMANHLFLSESSIIISAVGFWTDAGERLLELANKVGPPCGDVEKVDFDLRELKAKVAYERLMERVAEIAGVIWYFLAFGSPYLELIQNPIILDKNGGCSVKGNGSVRDGLFELGSLCFTYGLHMSEICFGHDISM